MEAEQVILVIEIKPHSFWISGHVKGVYTFYNIRYEIWCSSLHGTLLSRCFFLEWTKTKEKI
jgi:frataxin-like iron-binding protein CyaY